MEVEAQEWCSCNDLKGRSQTIAFKEQEWPSWGE